MNFTKPREDFSQHENIFKLTLQNHEVRYRNLEQEQLAIDQEHFEDIDQRVFKHKVQNWLKDAKDE